MADNYKKCDLCGVFFPTEFNYTKLDLPAHRHMNKSTMNGMTNTNEPPHNLPIRCLVEMQRIDVCSACLEEIIATLRRLNRAPWRKDEPS